MKATNFFLTYFVLILASLHAFGQIPTPKKDYHTVLKIPHLLSGSFAEPRGNHFHSGIDIKTNGKTGYRVYSIDEGYVSRIKVSAYGYGYAVYINHPGGITSVYGHLSKYSDKISKYIKEKQYQKESFYIDYFPKKTDLPIVYGEVIGLSGNSGSSGGPHLHFEVRDTKTERPFQPVGFGAFPKDNIKPRFQSLVLFPLDGKSRVNGKSTPQRFEVVEYDGQYIVKSNPTILVTGEIGVGFQATDYTNGSQSRCGLNRAVLEQGNETIYSFLLDDFSFAQTRYLNAHTNYKMYKQYRRWVHQMFRLPGNYLDIYTEKKNDGIVSAQNLEAAQTFSIEVEDQVKNTSSLVFTMKRSNAVVSDIPEKMPQIRYNQNNHFARKGFSMTLPKGAVYEDVHFTSKQTSSKLSIYPVYSIMNEYVPIQKSSTLVMDGSMVSPENRSKIVAGYRSNNGKKFSSIGGKWKGDSLHVSTRSFGEFTFITDKTGPTIQALSIKSKTTLTESSRIRFKITDNFSGVKSVRGMLDGKWILLEHDGKTYRHTYNFDYSRIQKGKSHTLSIVAVDGVGNKTEYKAKFWK